MLTNPCSSVIWRTWDSELTLARAHCSPANRFLSWGSLWFNSNAGLVLLRVHAENLEHGSLVQGRVQKLLCLMAAASSVVPLDLLHMRPLQVWLKGCVPPDLVHRLTPSQSDPWLCQGLGPTEIIPLLSEQDNAAFCFQKESGYDGHLHPMRRQNSLWLMGDSLYELAHQPSRNAGCNFGLQGVLVAYINHQGGVRS